MSLTQRLLLTVLFAASCFGVAAGQAQGGAAKKVSGDEAAVLAADRAWAAAIARGDLKTLGELFAEEFVIVSPNGELKNKQQEINNLAPAPDVTTYYFRTEDAEARV